MATVIQFIMSYEGKDVVKPNIYKGFDLRLTAIYR